MMGSTSSIAWTTVIPVIEKDGGLSIWKMNENKPQIWLKQIGLAGIKSQTSSGWEMRNLLSCSDVEEDSS